MLREIGRRLRVLGRGARFEQDLDDEIRLHVEHLEAQLRAAGLPEDTVREAVRQRFGSTLRAREESVDAWGWRWLEQLVQDIRFGARTLAKQPGFTATTVVTLALATGATTAIFSVVNGVILRPLPLASPDRLVQVASIHPRGNIGFVLASDLDAYRRQSASFERFAGYELTTRQVPHPDGAERLTAVISDFEFFSLLGVEPIAGRTYRTGDPSAVAVLSGRYWTRAYQRDPSVLGRSITLSGNVWDPVRRQSILEHRTYTILGVMPDTFQFPYGVGAFFEGPMREKETDIWIPQQDVTPRRFGQVTGRLKPSVTVDAAASELGVIQRQQDAITPSQSRPKGAVLTPLAEEVLGSIPRTLWLLFGAVGLVLAAACANVANLLLARTAVRTREVVTRAALGAGRLRLVRQFLTESVLLALGGGLLGVGVAWGGTRLLLVLGSVMIPRAHEVTLDWRTFAFLLAICFVTAILFGLAPAVSAARADARHVLREPGARTTASRIHTAIRDGLVIAEVALAFVLAVGAGLVVRELGRLQRADTGMTNENIVTLHLTPKVPAADYFAIEARVAQTPGVQAAGFTQMVPLQNWGWIGDFSIVGRPLERRPTAELRTITPGYFQTLGIPIVRGRNLTQDDTRDDPSALLINETLARTHFPDEDPVGRELDRGRIVGVVGDVRQTRLDRPVQPEMYSTVTRNAGIAADIGMTLMVRTQGPPETIVAAVRAAVREVNPNLAIFNVKTMAQVRADSLWELNLYRWLIGLFAGLALLIAVIGLYGVIAYSVSSRTREFAVRLALGSDALTLIRLVVRRGMLLAAIGLGLGGTLALAATPLLRALPSPLDPDVTTFAATAVVLLALTLIACTLPALRVVRVDPIHALRQD